MNSLHSFVRSSRGSDSSRSHPEWQRVALFSRGHGSLQPGESQLSGNGIIRRKAHRYNSRSSQWLRIFDERQRGPCEWA